MKKNYVIAIFSTLILIIIILVILLIAPSKKWQEENNKMENIHITINNQTYDLILEDNETARRFIELLPKEFNMQELNNNEKYIYLDTILPQKEENIKTITKGSVMLYGDRCLVIFYKTFSTNYRYTKIGYINNLPDLPEDNLTVKIFR